MNSQTEDRILVGMVVLQALFPGEVFSCEQIADCLDCNPGTIRNIEKKALAKLRRKVKWAGIETFESPLDCKRRQGYTSE